MGLRECGNGGDNEFAVRELMPVSQMMAGEVDSHGEVKPCNGPMSELDDSKAVGHGTATLTRER